MPHALSVETGLVHLAAHLRRMPPVASLGARPLGYDGKTLRLAAPLTANVNDKGCAFGGSLSGLMTLAGWGWITLRLQLAGLDAEVYVADSQVKYLSPLYEDLVAEAKSIHRHPATLWQGSHRNAGAGSDRGWWRSGGTHRSFRRHAPDALGLQSVVPE
jgi:thioesterase domain-containing protein